MSTNVTGAPPQAPNTPATGGPGGGGDPVGRAQVTRNNPPKRVMVLPGNTIAHAGQVYNDGESLLMAGGEADNFALQGHVVVTSHNEVEAWNGEEGDEVRRRAHAHVDANHKRFGAGSERDHDHGFSRYEHADGDEAIPVDLTSHRQQIAQDHLTRGHAMDDKHAGVKEGRAR